MPEDLVSNDNPEMEVAVLSETGLRQENQDWMSWSQMPWGECYIVADGMGGYKGGALAARMTVEGLETHLKEQPPDCPFDKALREAVRKTNEEVYQTAQSGNPETDHMGSTLAVALMSGNQLQTGHVGDTRIYLFRGGRLKLLTTDHTTVQRMVDAGMINQDEARKHPDAHILSRAMGSKAEVEIEIGNPVQLEEGDAILICSDGLSGYVEDKEIEQVVRAQSDVQRIPKQLVDLALKSGGDDNITVQFIRYGKPVPKKRRQTAKQGPYIPSEGIREFFHRLPANRPAWAAAFAVAAVFAISPVWNIVKDWRNPNPVTVQKAGPTSGAALGSGPATPSTSPTGANVPVAAVPVPGTPMQAPPIGSPDKDSTKTNSSKAPTKELAKAQKNPPPSSSTKKNGGGAPGQPAGNPPTGTSGPPGNTGAAGSKGGPATTGSMGTTGATGTASATGTTGATGTASATGTTGATGTAGVTGNTGATGTTGTGGGSAQQLRVVISAGPDPDKYAESISHIKDALKSMNFAIEVTTKDLGEPPSEPATWIYYPEETLAKDAAQTVKDAAQTVLAALDKVPEFKNKVKKAAYHDGRIGRYQQQIQKEPGEKHLLIVLPKQEQ